MINIGIRYRYIFIKSTKHKKSRSVTMWFVKIPTIIIYGDGNWELKMFNKTNYKNLC